MSCRGSSTTTQHKTAEITVETNPRYIPDVETDAGHFVFAYEITIANNGATAVRLLARRWRITDGNNNEQTVEGAGVVGEQPRILPGGAFSYTSFVNLPTPVGCMSGAYIMENADGEKFEAAIGVFSLAAPRAMH